MLTSWLAQELLFPPSFRPQKESRGGERGRVRAVGAEARTEPEKRPPHRQAGTLRGRDRHRGVTPGGHPAFHRRLPWERSRAGQGSGLRLPTRAGAPICSGPTSLQRRADQSVCRAGVGQGLPGDVRSDGSERVRILLWNIKLHRQEGYTCVN